MPQYSPFLSAVFIRQMDASAGYYYQKISDQYDPITGIEYAEAVTDEIRRKVNSICLNPNLYAPYEFKSRDKTINDILNKLDWKSTTTRRFHNRLFFFVGKNRIYFSSLCGAGQNTDQLIVSDIDFEELGLLKPTGIDKEDRQ